MQVFSNNKYSFLLCTREKKHQTLNCFLHLLEFTAKSNQNQREKKKIFQTLKFIIAGI